MAAPTGGRATSVLQIGELDIVVGQHNVDLVRDGRGQFVEEGPGSRTCGLFASRAKVYAGG